MRALCCIVSLLLMADSYANEIDKLHSNADVSNFLIKRISKQFKEQPVLENNTAQTDTAAFSRNSFFKTDIDNNQLTDLIIYGNKLMVILDKGNNDYQVRYLDRGPYLPRSADLIFIDTAATPKKIVVRQFKNEISQYDTLVYLFNSFIEYNRHPLETLVFEQVHFATSRCLGECPVFQMTIRKDRAAAYNAMLFNELTGNFIGTIPQNEFDELLQLLKYINPDQVKDAYSVNWTDDQTAFTKITFNGRSKVIRDYGRLGTYGLGILYLKFLRWRTSVDWSEQ